MARRSGLRTRLARLERKQPKAGFYRRFVFALDDDEEAGKPIGYYAKNITVMRKPSGETLAECQSRAFSIIGTHTIFALYGSEVARAPVERDSEASPTPQPPQRPVRPLAALLASLGTLPG